MRIITALFLLWISDGGSPDGGVNVFPSVSKGLGNSFYQDSQTPPVDWKNFFNFTRQRRGVIGKITGLRNEDIYISGKRYKREASKGGIPAGLKQLKLASLSGNGTVMGKGDNGVVGELVAQDQAGNVAAGMAELQLPGQGVTGPIYELVGAGIKLQQPTNAPPTLPKGKNSSAVGEVTVNIQHTNQEKHPKKKARHWCDLSGVWINDEGSLLLTLGFPSSDQTLLTGYLSQVSVDMTPTEEGGWRRRRRRHARRRRHHDRRRRRRQHRRRRGLGLGLGSSRRSSEPPPRFPPPPAGTSGIPSSLTNRTVLQGSAVTRAGPFTVVTRHGGGAVGSMIGQCQVCGGLDTIVAQFVSVSEVFACIDALWSHKSVNFMFRKWGERHRRRHHQRPQLLETEVVIKQRDRSRTPPPPPPHRETETVEIEEEVVEKISRR